MNAYVTRKEYLCLCENQGKKQRGPRIITGRGNKKNRKTDQGAVELLLEAFNGEVVSPSGVKLFNE